MGRIVKEGSGLYRLADFHPTEKPLVLVVDDDSLQAGLYIDALDDRGFDVVYKNTARLALRAAERRVFDAVIIDVMMPYVVCSGLKNTRWISDGAGPRQRDCEPSAFRGHRRSHQPRRGRR